MTTSHPHSALLPRTLLADYHGGIRRSALLAFFSGVFWTGVAQLGDTGATFAALGTSVLLIVILVVSIAGRPATAVALIAYMVAIQPAVRLHAPALPYLAFAYVLPIYGVCLLLRSSSKLTLTYAVLAYSGYFVLELTGVVLSDSLVYARSVLVPSGTLLLFLVMAAHLRLAPVQYTTVMRAYLIGISSLAALVLRAYLAGPIAWTTQSNFASAGGMAPNQIALLLAGASFISICWSQQARGTVRLTYAAAAAFFSILMVLTFSRGGLYILAGAVLLYQTTTSRPNARTAATLIVYALIAVLLYRVSMDLTAGKVVERYSELNTSNRVLLAQVAWEMFRDNPVRGVGTGNYYTLSQELDYFGSVSGAHNEFTRAAAEHGVLGIMAWLSFAVACLYQAARMSTGAGRAFRIGLAAVALVSMCYNGMKIVAQPFMLYLALVPVLPVLAPPKRSLTRELAEERVYSGRLP